MRQSIAKYMYTIYATTIGIILGTFIGLFIIGTLIRMILDAMYGYGDTGPLWVSVIIIMESIVVVVLVTRISVNWMRDYLNKKKS